MDPDYAEADGKKERKILSLIMWVQWTRHALRTYIYKAH